MSLYLKADPSFDKILQYNVKFFMRNVDTCGSETGVCFEYDRVWTPELVICLGLVV